MNLLRLNHTNPNLIKTIMDNRNDIDNRTYRNFGKTFLFRECFFYSYNEPIAYLVMDDNNAFEKLKIYGKTAKYGNFFSNTTSKHILLLINYCKENEIDFEIVGINGNAIQDSFHFVNDLNSEKENCSICLDLGKKKFCKTNCGHLFHKNCLNIWNKSQKANNLEAKCPLCNQLF